MKDKRKALLRDLVDQTTKVEVNQASPVKKANSLRVDMSWTLIGNFIYRGCQWGILMVLAKLTTAGQVGKFALGLAIVTPIIMFSQLHLRSVQVTDVTDSYKFGEYLSLRFLGVSVVLLLSSLIAVVCYSNRVTISVIILIAVAKIIESVSDIIYGVFQKNMRMDIVARSMIFKGIASLCFISAVLWFTRSIVMGVIALGVSWLLILLIYDIRQARRFDSIKPIFNKQHLWKITVISSPLGIMMGLIYLQSSIPRFFVEKNFGESALGYFAAISYVVVIGNMFMMAMGQSATARLAQYYRLNLFAFKLLITKLVFAALVLGLVTIILGMILGEWFLKTVYTSEYAQYYDLFVLLLFSCAIAFIASVLGYAITAARYFKVLVPQNIIILLICIISAYFLIPHYGLKGGAWTLIITNLVRVLSFVVILVVAIAGRSQRLAKEKINADK